MNIGISLFQFLKGKVGGAGEYIEQLTINMIDQLKPGERLILIGNEENLLPLKKYECDKVVLARFPFSPYFVKALRFFDVLFPDFFSVFMGRRLKRFSLDVVLFPQQSIFPHGIDAKKVVTVLDLVHEHFPGNFSKQGLFIRRKKENYLFKNSDGVIAISRATRNDILKMFNFPESKCRVIYLGGGKDIDISSLEEEKILNEPYILYPANTYPHKNHLRLIQAFIEFKKEHKSIKGKLVLTGKILDKKLNDLLNNNDVKKDIVHLGYLPKRKLNFLLQHSEALFFPSLFEGFGIPVIEGMGAEKPVFCSGLPVFKEILGDSVFYFDPMKRESMIRQFEKIFINKRIFIDKVKYHNILETINWNRCAMETLIFLREVAGLD